MGKLKAYRPDAREFVTEVLDQATWWKILAEITEFLRAKAVPQVRVEFGFVLRRDLKGETQPPSQIVELGDLVSFVRRGFDEGTIEWAAQSDFTFHAVGSDISFMLCNDKDLHFASRDSALLTGLGSRIRSCGVKVYDSGRLV